MPSIIIFFYPLFLFIVKLVRSCINMSLQCHHFYNLLHFSFENLFFIESNFITLQAYYNIHNANLLSIIGHHSELKHLKLVYEDMLISLGQQLHLNEFFFKLHIGIFLCNDLDNIMLHYDFSYLISPLILRRSFHRNHNRQVML